MIFYDNFLPNEVLEETLAYIDYIGFEDWKHGDKTFNAVHPSKTLIELSTQKLELLLNRKLDLVFSFIRRATPEIDTNWNIHADQWVGLDQPKLAAVWYLSKKPKGVTGGTAVWTHDKWGTHLTGNEDEYNEQRAHENNKDEFELDQVVGYKQNRVVVYDANRFHSAYPNNAGFERIVMASFFK